MADEEKLPAKINNGLLIAGIIWIALGLFGLIFDPSKTLIITSQFIAGLIFIGYYLFTRLKKS